MILMKQRDIKCARLFIDSVVRSVSELGTFLTGILYWYICFIMSQQIECHQTKRSEVS